MRCPIISMQYEQTTLEDIFLALTDDSVRPDENGVLPSVEEILSGRFKKEKDTLYEHMSDEELASLSDETSSDSETEAENENKNDDDGDTNNDNGTEDSYKPLFGGK